MSDTDLTWLFQILISFSFGFIIAWLIAGWIFLPRRRRPRHELYRNTGSTLNGSPLPQSERGDATP